MGCRPRRALLMGFVVLFVGAANTTHAQEAELMARDGDGGDPVSMPLLSERHVIRVDHQLVTRLTERVYQNETGEVVEGNYRLRVAEGARVIGFSYWNGTQKIIGELFERETARRVYEETTGLERDPGLLEEDGDGAFTFRVFPIAAGERKRVEVTTEHWLARDRDAIELHVPVSSPNATFDVALTDPRGLQAITSPTHAIDVSGCTATQCTVGVRSALGAPSELVLRATIAEAPTTPSIVVHRDEGEDAYFTLVLGAPTDERAATLPKDVTLVIDQSGSMSGEPLANARSAAEQIIARLRATDRVNVVAFDDGVTPLFQAPELVSDAIRARAIEFVRGIVEGGGTDIAGALRATLAAQGSEARPRYVLFLTDGQSDPQAALQAARDDTRDVRVFTVGIGGGVERSLLSRLATDKRGRYTAIADAGEIEAKVARLYDQIDAPLVVDLSLDVQGGRVLEVFPRTLPDLFRRDELRISGRLEGSGPMRFTLRGRNGHAPVVFTKEIVVPREERRTWVGRAWATQRIDALLEEVALGGETEPLKNEIIELSLAYNVSSPYTAFLAIPESELLAESRELLGNARAARRSLLEKHRDAARLSRDLMPPGDPVISVVAAPSSRSVRARFPFGLELPLAWDSFTERWSTRFLVPHDVADGVYVVELTIVDVFGVEHVESVEYTIDSQAPAVVVDTRVVDGGIELRVQGDEALREVVVAASENAQRQSWLVAEDARTFRGVVPLVTGRHTLRVLVVDEARNDDVLEIEVHVP